MSRLVTLDPDITLVKEPEGYQFGKQIGPYDDVIEAEVKLISLAPVVPASKPGKPMDPIPDKDILQWGISQEEIIQRQKADKCCQSIRNRIMKAESDCVFYPYFQGFMEGRSLLVVYGFYFSQLSREVPHGTKGTGPRFVKRPVYSRSQLRNNTNTVSVLVLLMHLFHTLYTRYAGISHHWALQTSR